MGLLDEHIGWAVLQPGRRTGKSFSVVLRVENNRFEHKIRGERGILTSGLAWAVWKEDLGICGIHGRVIDDQVDPLATSTAPSHSWLEHGYV